MGILAFFITIFEIIYLPCGKYITTPFFRELIAC
jgi:hypothetical protein